MSVEVLSTAAQPYDKLHLNSFPTYEW